MYSKERMSETSKNFFIDPNIAIKGEHDIEHARELLTLGYEEADVMKFLTDSRGWSPENATQLYSQAMLKNRLPELEQNKPQEAAHLADKLFGIGYSPAEVRNMLEGKNWSKRKAAKVMYGSGSGEKMSILPRNLLRTGYEPRRIIEILVAQGRSEEDAIEVYSHISEQEQSDYIDLLWKQMKEREDERKASGQLESPQKKGKRLFFNPGHTRHLVTQVPTLMKEEHFELHSPVGLAEEPQEGFLFSSLSVDELHEFLKEHPEQTDFMVDFLTTELAQYWNQIGSHIQVFDVAIARPALLEKLTPKLDASLQTIQKDLHFIADQLEAVREFIKPLAVENDLPFIELKSVVQNIEDSAMKLRESVEGIEVTSVPKDNAYLAWLTVVSNSYKDSPYAQALSRRTLTETGKKDLQKVS
jgi:hypothetical protein